MTTITRIATIQRSLRELGRIRLGEKGPKGEPRKLLTFRLTSASREYIESAAEAYGGKVTEWTSPRGREYQITIESPTLDVLVPPGDAVAQAYELWTSGGCQRRCNGIAQETGEACACPAEPAARQALAAKGQACQPTTRLWVILPRLPDLGRWRLETHGYYAAVELAGMAEIAAMATARGIMLQARLRIDHRRRKVPGQPTRDYIVPVLELPETNFGQLVAAGHIQTTEGQLEAGMPPALGAGATPQLAPGRPQRVARPALGPAPELPSEAAFERPASPSYGAPPEAVGGWVVDNSEGSNDTSDGVSPEPQPAAALAPSGAAAGAPSGQCNAPSPWTQGETCGLAPGHSGNHKSRNRESWNQ